MQTSNRVYHGAQELDLSYFFIKFLKTIFLPPGIFIVLFAGVLYLWNRRPLLAKRLGLATVIIFWLAATPLVSKSLMSIIESYPALDVADPRLEAAQAIVILGGGLQSTPEFGGATVSKSTLARLSYASLLARITNLPVLVTGGEIPDLNAKPEAEIMAQTMEFVFGIKPQWKEIQSLNTAQKARLSADILKENKIHTILLVSQAWHLQRAVSIFSEQGLNVIPAPTYFEGFNSTTDDFWLTLIFPNTDSLSHSYIAMHEIIGRIWYWIRY
ncbi:MAG: YdcF family protein [Gammaproteobacteria bacterium]|nr:YdcF family protein [Gammaproteobacteria bacterium]